jgi:hypothetical protein
VLPVSAQTITTDTQRPDAVAVTIPSGTFSMPAYRALPPARATCR